MRSLRKLFSSQRYGRENNSFFSTSRVFVRLKSGIDVDSSQSEFSTSIHGSGSRDFSQILSPEYVAVSASFARVKAVYTSLSMSSSASFSASKGRLRGRLDPLIRPSLYSFFVIDGTYTWDHSKPFAL